MNSEYVTLRQNLNSKMLGMETKLSVQRRAWTFLGTVKVQQQPE